MAEHHPLAGREQRPDCALHVVGFDGVHPAEPIRNADDVGVGGDPGDTESVPEHDVGGLAPHPGQFHQLVEAFWHPAVVVGNECASQTGQ